MIILGTALIGLLFWNMTIKAQNFWLREMVSSQQIEIQGLKRRQHNLQVELFKEKTKGGSNYEKRPF